jgi:putative tryptophan/tyrosine transport system substrate-binding protein
MKKVDRSLMLVALALLALGALAEAQQPVRVPHIGFLSASSLAASAARIGAFRQGLRELGYVEGKNIVIEFRSAQGEQDRLPALVAELIRLKIDVIVSAGPAVTRSAKQATTTIPIVMASDDDPVGSGFVASLARPGGNITGLATYGPEISGKQLELLKDTVPKLTRVGVLGDVIRPGTAQALNEINVAANALGVKLQYLEVRGTKDIETAFGAAGKERAEAVLVQRSGVLFSQRRQIADLAAKSGLPAIYGSPEYVEDGGLMSYSVSVPDQFRRATTYVAKILKGAKPADLPVEQPRKFEFIINLKAAKQIGLMIPPNVLARADKVIR